MTNQAPRETGTLDNLASIVYAAAILAALGFYFRYYAPGIAEGTRSGTWLAGEVLWLELHIAAYWISYSLYFTGMLLAIICFLRKATTRFPWIETGTIIATILTVFGLITGILFSKPAWNAWWVWDPKHTVALLNVLVLLGISALVALLRPFVKPIDRNMPLTVLLLISVALCTGSILAGFMRNVHPQWFPYMLFQ